MQKSLISNLSDAIESKNLTIDERNLTSTQWVEYHVGTKRKTYNSLPTSNITAETVSVDGFALSQTNNAGVTTTTERSYTANGMIQTRTDGRNNTTTTVTDTAGRPLTITDAAGVRTLGYNAYGEQESDSLVADSVTHLITETRDDKGRSTGYTYSKNGTVQQTVTTGYGTDGRIATAGFLHGGAEKQFSYEYMAGTHLLEKLTMPNNMSLTQSYEIQRDLLTGMAYHRGTTLVANRQYSYDTLGRPTARNTSRQGTVKNDTFGYNNRSELTTATVNGSNYAYDYDNIGNRNTAQEVTEEITNYMANELNQYTAVGDFTPTFDADGNQTLVKTTTGIWSVTYDAENRPVSFSNTETNTIIECSYDSMGRRATKKVTVDGSITLHQRYIYRGYLQIDSGAPHCAFTLSGQTLRVCPTGLTAVVRFACCDLTRSSHPALWFITWDPTQPIATRPLAIQKDGTWFTYGWDLTKNICELYGSNGYIRTAYTYTPYGSVTESANSVYQPIQWSSEYNDTELDLVYYNYRHYNPLDGRWLGRDRVGIIFEHNLYRYAYNCGINGFDYIGEKVVINKQECRLTIKVKWYIKFEPPSEWKKGKSYWYNTAKNLIENYFNNINNFKCYSEKEDCCMCKDGISARVTIEKAAYEKIADYKIIVYKRTKIKRTYKDNNNVYFNYEDINTVTNYDTNGKSYEQITIIHEFGHMLGLSHPGKDPNSISDQGKSIEYDIMAPEFRTLV